MPKSGMVSGIRLEGPDRIIVVKNIKTDFAIRNFLPTVGHPSFKDIGERNRWVFKEWERLGIEKPKPDGYGLPGGKIDDYEYEHYPKDYFDYALPREWSEEAGTLIVEEAGVEEDGKRKFMPTYERITMFYAKSRDHTTEEDHEHFFFHVLKMHGELRTDGVEGETEAPRIIEIKKLTPERSSQKRPEGCVFFYSKHALGVTILLKRLVSEGKTEYQESLDHMRRTFTRTPQDLGLSEKPKDRKIEPLININLSDEELFVAEMQKMKVKTK